MLKVTRLITRSFDLDHVDLFWEIEDFSSSKDIITAYEMYVLRGESSEGPFEEIGGPLKDEYSFRDTSPNLLHKWRQLHYKLKIVDTRTDEVEEHGPVSLGAEPDLMAIEIRRQHEVLLKQYTGRLCWVFPVRTFGPKCLCYDPVLSRRTKSNCLNCFDTGYLGGFHTPVETYIQLDPSADTPSNRPVGGEVQNTNTTARLIYPSVKPKDIIVDAENNRWRVAVSVGTERLGFTVHYQLTLHQIPKGDVEYKLPINIEDLKNKAFAEERNFTNPQHPDDD